ncbi:hypothetical protein AAG906_037538 [Vitis piasezkii]
MALGNLFHLPHHKTLWDASGFLGLNDFLMALLTGTRHAIYMKMSIWLNHPGSLILTFPLMFANSIRWSMVSNKHHGLKQFLVFFSFINSHANTSLFILTLVIPHKHGLLLLQHRYNKDLVCTKMIDIKRIVTPLATNPTLTLHSSTTLWESSISISHLTRYYISNQHVISIHALPNN